MLHNRSHSADIERDLRTSVSRSPPKILLPFDVDISSDNRQPHELAIVDMSNMQFPEDPHEYSSVEMGNNSSAVGQQDAA